MLRPTSSAILDSFLDTVVDTSGLALLVYPPMLTLLASALILILEGEDKAKVFEKASNTSTFPVGSHRALKLGGL